MLQWFFPSCCSPLLQIRNQINHCIRNSLLVLLSSRHLPDAPVTLSLVLLGPSLGPATHSETQHRTCNPVTVYDLAAVVDPAVLELDCWVCLA